MRVIGEDVMLDREKEEGIDISAARSNPKRKAGPGPDRCLISPTRPDQGDGLVSLTSFTESGRNFAGDKAAVFLGLVDIVSLVVEI